MDGNFLVTGEFEVMLSKGLGLQKGAFILGCQKYCRSSSDGYEQKNSRDEGRKTT
jgi:hypothetical protein